MPKPKAGATPKITHAGGKHPARGRYTAERRWGRNTLRRIARFHAMVKESRARRTPAYLARIRAPKIARALARMEARRAALNA